MEDYQAWVPPVGKQNSIIDKNKLDQDPEGEESLRYLRVENKRTQVNNIHKNRRSNMMQKSTSYLIFPQAYLQWNSSYGGRTGPQVAGVSHLQQASSVLFGNSSRHRCFHQ